MSGFALGPASPDDLLVSPHMSLIMQCKALIGLHEAPVGLTWSIKNMSKVVPTNMSKVVVTALLVAVLLGSVVALSMNKAGKPSSRSCGYT